MQRRKCGDAKAPEQKCEDASAKREDAKAKGGGGYYYLSFFFASSHYPLRIFAFALNWVFVGSLYRLKIILAIKMASANKHENLG